MIDFRPVRSENLREEISSVLGGKKILLSNFFYKVESETCDIYKGNNTVIIRVSEYDFYRMFVQTADVEELVALLKELEKNKYVINIPSKKPIDDWKLVFERADFKNIGIYNRYYTTKVKYRKSGAGEFAEPSDFDFVDNLLKGYFSLYTDYLPTKAQLQLMIENKQVLVSRDENNEIKGVLIFTLEGKKCYFNAWIDFSGKGLFLLYKGYNIAAEHDINYAYFWVNSTNTDVINLHKMMGAVPDGLVDYTYLNI